MPLCGMGLTAKRTGMPTGVGESDESTGTVDGGCDEIRLKSKLRKGILLTPSSSVLVKGRWKAQCPKLVNRALQQQRYQSKPPHMAALSEHFKSSLLLNLMPCLSPLEKLYGCIPNYSSLRVFGSTYFVFHRAYKVVIMLCYAHLPLLYKEAVIDPLWQRTMNEELFALQKTYTWVWQTLNASSSSIVSLRKGKVIPLLKRKLLWLGLVTQVVGRNTQSSDVIGSWQRHAPGNQTWPTNKYGSSAKNGEVERCSIPYKDRSLIHQEERLEPCHLSSSIYYGGQDVYSQSHSSQISESSYPVVPFIIRTFVHAA
uniref:Uncharacterized protein n=1 Tax=Cannabis sativa TaxID=3483 RepID=A0A803PUB4_CANSA